jgi:hypothetical protein
MGGWKSERAGIPSSWQRLGCVWKTMPKSLNIIISLFRETIQYDCDFKDSKYGKRLFKLQGN